MNRILQTLFLIAIAAADTAFIAAYGEQLNGARTTLPPIAGVILASPGYIWLLPLVTLIAYLVDRLKLSTGPLPMGWIGSTAFALGLAWVPIALYGSYLSFISLAAEGASVAH